VSISRGHRFKVRGGKLRGMCVGEVSTQRVVGARNTLREEVVEADKLAFMTHLDGYRDRAGDRGTGTE